MNITRIGSYVFSLAAFALIVGCKTESTTDPLVGWKSVGTTEFTGGAYQTYIDKIPFDKTIADDVRNFVEKLPIVRGRFVDRSENYWIDELSFFENGTGQRAVRIHIPLNGIYQNYVLIYDSSNVRVKVIKFSSGHYAC